MTLNVPVENYKLLMSAAFALRNIVEKTNHNFYIPEADLREAKKIVSDLKGIVWK